MTSYVWGILTLPALVILYLALGFIWSAAHRVLSRLVVTAKTQWLSQAGQKRDGFAGIVSAATRLHAFGVGPIVLIYVRGFNPDEYRHALNALQQHGIRQPASLHEAIPGAFRVTSHD